MKPLLRHIILFFAAWTAMTACQDDFARGESYDEGMATITATIDFKPMASALTRSADGKALSDLDYLYILIYDADGNLYRSISVHNPESSLLTITDEERADSDAEVEDSSGKKESAEKTTKRAWFTLWDKIPYGSYYMYAVANIPTLLTEQRYIDAIQSVEGLKNITLYWDEKKVTNNGEMIGYFTPNTEPMASENTPLVVGRETKSIHAWLRRAASKVTIAYDGSGLNDDVKIYILTASIKDIPRTCPLGNKNTPAKAEDLIHEGDTIKYYTPGSYKNIQDFFNETTGYKCVVSNSSLSWKGSEDHSEKDEALFFYENMQGTGKDKTQKDVNNDGEVDDKEIEKDAMPYGTYIEVDAIYTSEAGNGTIKYRFMLGKNTTTDYDASRNCHYKLTLKFKGTAKDPDWHIDFQEQVFEVSEPKVMDYRGKVFVPEYRPWTENYNLGHTFGDNIVTVSSYIEDSQQWVPWEMQFSIDGGATYKDYEDYTNGELDWLKIEITDGPLPYVKNVKFGIDTGKSVEEVNIDALLKDPEKAPQKGSVTAPYNLADPSQGVTSPESATIQNTANCYIVDAPGWYLLPAVYGNAIKDREDNKSAYIYADGQDAGTEAEKILGTFKDHLGNPISSPYITDKYTPQKAFIVWQDENDLIHYDVDYNNITWTKPFIQYLPEAYGGHGGILFQIGDIRQGNAVIGLSDKAPSSTDLSTSPNNFPPMMWSWHIWVTNFSFLEPKDETIEVTGHDISQKFNLLPFNLGWCSDYNETTGQHSHVKYYKARKCDVKFYVPDTGKAEVITLEQKSHIAITRGTSPYYQWGRKDPFVGATDNNTNKRRYISVGWANDANPEMLFPVDTPNDERCTTKEALDEGLLIQKPHIWHNPKRKERDPLWTWDTYDYVSLNEVYTNLWRQPDNAKTVYDPCPVGYQVPAVETFSGFTTTGDNTDTDWEWYDVQKENITDYDASVTRGGIYYAGLYEFYTNPDKLQSIVIPESGYRDWDDMVCAYKVNIETPIGYLWTTSYKENVELLNHKYIFNFEFARKDENGNSYIRPRNKFYSCDGFPVRPVKTEQ